MNIHELTKEKLSQCDRVVYMHADHFEPSNTNDSTKVDSILKRMISDIKKGFYKPSLFLKITASMQWRNNEPFYKMISNHDMIMSHVKTLSDLGCDIHLHVHHERWTHSELTNAEWAEPFEKGIITDSELFELFIRRSLEELDRYKIPTKNWCFVHGRWALNASDDLSCNITDEISILRRNGCIADFTMPAGRTVCVPSMSGIYAIKPRNVAKCYDVGIPISRGSHLLDDPDAFIMCFPSTNYFYVSLDNLILKAGTLSKTFFRSAIAEDNNERFAKCPEDPMLITQEWLLCSCILDRTLIIKTHSHNMRLVFWEDEYGNLVNNSPIFNNNQKERMYLLQQICKDHNVDFKLATARELLKYVKHVDSGEEAKNYVW
jgi:hypothetical protein